MNWLFMRDFLFKAAIAVTLDLLNLAIFFSIESISLLYLVNFLFFLVRVIQRYKTSKCSWCILSIAITIWVSKHLSCLISFFTSASFSASELALYLAAYMVLSCYPCILVLIWAGKELLFVLSFYFLLDCPNLALQLPNDFGILYLLVMTFFLICIDVIKLVSIY